MSHGPIDSNFLRSVHEGQYLKDKKGNAFKIKAVYNKGGAAHQVLLEGEHYPHLLSELVKLGYTLRV